MRCSSPNSPLMDSHQAITLLKSGLRRGRIVCKRRAGPAPYFEVNVSCSAAAELVALRWIVILSFIIVSHSLSINELLFLVGATQLAVLGSNHGTLLSCLFLLSFSHQETVSTRTSSATGHSYQVDLNFSETVIYRQR